MSGRRKALILVGILLLVALGAGAALASDDDEDRTIEPTLVDDELEGAFSDSSEADDLDGANELGGREVNDGAEDRAEGPDVPITGPDLERASRVALDYLGGGRVTDTEVEDEESYYEIEVTRDDGSQIDVQLDGSFNVVGTD
jgi:uncharacterized membrane protein YkoI